MKKLSKTEARREAMKAGIDFHKDFYVLSPSEVDILLGLRKAVGYRKPANANGSTGRYFFYYLQRAR